MKLLCHCRLLCFFFFSRMCVCLLLFHSLSVLWTVDVFFSPSIQNFIDSLCRQSVDIGYYYYFGFVLHMACCELISIGYFFVCLSRISRSNTCSFHFKLEWCVCVCLRYHLSVVEKFFTWTEQHNREKNMSNTFSAQITPAIWNMFHFAERIFNYCQNVIWFGRGKFFLPVSSHRYELVEHWK